MSLEKCSAVLRSPPSVRHRENCKLHSAEEARARGVDNKVDTERQLMTRVECRARGRADKWERGFGAARTFGASTRPISAAATLTHPPTTTHRTQRNAIRQRTHQIFKY
jgi:hypothetical protein